MEIYPKEALELRKQRYSGTKTVPRRTHLEEYTTKEFRRESDVAEIFHENTKSTVPGERNPVFGDSVNEFLNSNRAKYSLDCLYPEYRHHEEVSLPEPESLDVPLGEVLEQRRSGRSYVGAGISRQTLSNLLYYGCGVVRRNEHLDVQYESEETETLTRDSRSYPSPGGLYGVEPYIAVRNEGDGVEPGLYHYSPSSHSLRRLREGDASFLTEFENVWIDNSAGVIDYDDAALSVLLVGAFWRLKAKYGPRGYRLLLEEAGHLCQNLHLVATAIGLASVPAAGYLEDEADDLLGVNGVDEGIVHSLVLGVPTESDTDE